jgi:hypothetical protein
VNPWALIMCKSLITSNNPYFFLKNKKPPGRYFSSPAVFLINTRPSLIAVESMDASTWMVEPKPRIIMQLCGT